MSDATARHSAALTSGVHAGGAPPPALRASGAAGCPTPHSHDVPHPPGSAVVRDAHGAVAPTAPLGNSGAVGRRAHAASGAMEPVDTAGMDAAGLAAYKAVKLLVSNVLMQYYAEGAYFAGDREAYFRHVRLAVARVLDGHGSFTLADPELTPRAVADVLRDAQQYVEDCVRRPGEAATHASPPPPPSVYPETSPARSARFDDDDVVGVDTLLPEQVGVAEG